MPKLTHPKNKSLYLIIPDEPEQPYLDLLNTHITIRKDLFHYESIPIHDMISVLNDAVTEGCTEIYFDQHGKLCGFKTETPEENKVRIEKEQKEYEENLKEYKVLYQSCKDKLQEMFDEKQRLYKQKNEKYKDPEYIEYLRIQAKLKNKGLLD